MATSIEPGGRRRQVGVDLVLAGHLQLDQAGPDLVDVGPVDGGRSRQGEREVRVGGDVDEPVAAQQAGQLAPELEVDAALGQQRDEPGPDAVGQVLLRRRRVRCRRTAGSRRRSPRRPATRRGAGRRPCWSGRPRDGTGGSARGGRGPGRSRHRAARRRPRRGDAPRRERRRRATARRRRTPAPSRWRRRAPPATTAPSDLRHRLPSTATPPSRRRPRGAGTRRGRRRWRGPRSAAAPLRVRRPLHLSAW